MDKNLQPSRPSIYPPQSQNNATPEQPTQNPAQIKSEEPVSPYATEIDPREVADTAEPADEQAVAENQSPAVNPSSTYTPSPNDNLPHKPHHFATKKAVILGALFVLTALLSSFVTFSLVNSRAKDTIQPTPAPKMAISPTVEPTQTYKNELFGFNFNYPKGWLVEEIPNINNITDILALNIKSPYTDGLYSINVVLGPAGLGGGPCTESPTGNEVGRENIQIYGKSFDILFEKNQVSGIVDAINIVKPDGFTTCYGKALDIQDISTDLGNSSISLTNTQPITAEEILISKEFSEAKKILKSFMITPSDVMTPGTESGVCTLDAKICSDGSSVGRVPPSCDFAACPL